MSDEDLEQLMQQEWAPVLAVAVALVGRSGTAEELTQEAFFAAHQRWDHVGSLDRPGAWVRRVLINRAVSQLRRRRVEQRVLGVVGRRAATVAEQSSPTRPAVDDPVWAEVRRLPTRQAQCVVLRHVDGLSTPEIAEVLGCAEATVRVHLHRGLGTLRDRLEPSTPTLLEPT